MERYFDKFLFAFSFHIHLHVNFCESYKGKLIQPKFLFSVGKVNKLWANQEIEREREKENAGR